MEPPPTPPQSLEKAASGELQRKVLILAHHLDDFFHMAPTVIATQRSVGGQSPTTFRCRLRRRPGVLLFFGHIQLFIMGRRLYRPASPTDLEECDSPPFANANGMARTDWGPLGIYSDPAPVAYFAIAPTWSYTAEIFNDADVARPKYFFLLGVWASIFPAGRLSSSSSSK